MFFDVRSFLSNDSGAVTLDWVVLTAALVGTGVAVLTTVSGGLDSLTLQTNSQLNGAVVRTTFAGDLCEGGVEALQTAENTRVALARADGLDVSARNVVETMDALTSEFSDEELLAAYAEKAAAGPGVAFSAATEIGALECEIVRRGLL